jgi:hypothetical protein
VLNNQGVEAKYNITLELDGLTGVKGDVNGTVCQIETQIRIEVSDVGPANVLFVQGRMRNSPNWYEIATITGPDNSVHDVSTYDYVRYVILVADGVGFIYGSGFIFGSPGGSSVTAWGSIIGFLSNQADLVAALFAKQDTIVSTTSADYYRGDKTFQPLNKSAVGLSNVANLDTSTTQNISDYTDKRFVTDAELTVLANTSGTNTGDQTNISGNSGTTTAALGLKTATTTVSIDSAVAPSTGQVLTAINSTSAQWVATSSLTRGRVLSSINNTPFI